MSGGRYPGRPAAGWRALPAPAGRGRVRQNRARVTADPPASGIRRWRSSAESFGTLGRRESCRAHSASRVWKSSRRQRERMVGSSRPGEWDTSRNRLLAGGSSSVLRSACAACGSSSSMQSMIATRQSPRLGATANNSCSLRTWSMMMPRRIRLSWVPVSWASRLIRRKSGWLPASISRTIGCLAGVSRPGRPTGDPPASARTRRAAARAKLPFPTPRGPGKQPGVMQAAAVHRGAEGGDRAILAEDGHNRSANAASRRAVTSSGDPRGVDQPDPFGFGRGNGAERLFNGLVVGCRTPPDPVRCLAIARLCPLGAVGMEKQAGCDRETSSAIPKALIARTSSMPSPPAPP